MAFFICPVKFIRSKIIKEVARPFFSELILKALDLKRSVWLFVNTFSLLFTLMVNNHIIRNENHSQLRKMIRKIQLNYFCLILYCETK